MLLVSFWYFRNPYLNFPADYYIILKKMISWNKVFFLRDSLQKDLLSPLKQKTSGPNHNLGVHEQFHCGVCELR